MLSSNNSTDCTTLNHGQILSLTITRGITSTVCAVVCLILMLWLLVTKRWKTFSERLLLYMNLSTILFLLSMILQISRLFDKDDGWFCQAVGFLRQTTGFALLLIVFIISLYLLVLIITRLCCYKTGGLPSTTAARKKCIKRSCLEFCVLILPVTIISCGVGLVPWLTPVPYGDNGFWCWIEDVANNCTHEKHLIAEYLAIWYVPFGIVSLFNLVVLVFFLVVILLTKRRGGTSWDTIKTILRQSFVAFTFVIAFMILYCIELTVDIVRNEYPDDNVYPLLLLYAIFLPINAAIIPIAYCLHKVYNRFCFKRRVNRDISQPIELSTTYAPPSVEENIPSHTTLPVMYTSIGMYSTELKKSGYGTIQAQDFDNFTIIIT